MSSVDSRVVQMEFDDSNFDSGVQRAINSIKELDDELVLKNGTKGLENVQAAARSFDVSPAINGLQSIASTAASVAASTIQSFLSIAPGVNNAIQIVERLGGTIFNLMKEGGFARALNIEQATWKMKNLGMDVKATQEDIDYAVSGTRFGFDEAANAAAQFGASGVKSGEQMKTALRGISGVATMTNSEYQGIADVFTKIASNGHVMTMELRQISSRGLNAAKALADYFHTTEANIYDLVSKGKIGFDDFAKAMDAAFGEASTKANETFSGALANMKAAVKRIGAEVAAPVIDNARKIFVNVIPLVNTINNTFKSFGKGAYKEIKKPTDYIKKQLDETGKYTSKHGRIYEKQGKKYVEWVDSYYVKNPSEKLKKAMENTNYYVDKYGDTYKKVVTKNGTAIRKYISGESLFGVIRKDITKTQKVINKFITGFTEGGLDSEIGKYAYAFTKVFLGVRNIIIGIGHVIKPVGEAIALALKPIINADNALNLATTFNVLTKQFERFTSVAKIGEKTLLPLVGVISSGLTAALNKLTGVIASVSTIFDGFFKRQASAKELMSGITDREKKRLANMGLLAKATKALNGETVEFTQTQKRQLAAFGLLEEVEKRSNSKVKKLIEQMKTLFGLQPDKLSSGFMNLRKSYDNVLNGVKAFIDNLKNSVDAIKAPWENLHRILTLPVDRQMYTPMKEFFGMLSQAKDSLKNLQILDVGGAFEKISKKILQLSVDFNQFLTSTDGVKSAIGKIIQASDYLAGKAFQGIMVTLKFVNPILKTFIDTAMLIKTVAIEPVAKSFKHVSLYFSMFAEDVRHGKNIFEATIRLFGQLGNMAKRVANDMKKLFEESKYFEKLKSNIKRFGSAFVDFVWGAFGLDLSPFAKLLSTIYDKIHLLINLMFMGASPIRAFSEVFSDTGEQVKSAFEAFKQGSITIQKIGDVIAKVKNDFKEFFGSIEIPSFVEKIEPLSKLFDKFGNSETVGGINNLSAGFLKLGNSGEKTFDLFERFNSVNLDRLKNIIGEVGLSFKLFVTTISNGASPMEAFGNLINNLSLSIGNIFKLGDSNKNGGFSIIDSILGKFENINKADKAVNTFNTSLLRTGLIFAKDSEIIEGSGFSLQKGVEKLSQGFGSFIDLIKSKFKFSINFVEILSTALEKFKDVIAVGLTAAVAAASVAVVKGLFDVVKSLKTTASSIQETVDAFKTIPSSLEGIKESFQKNVKFNAILKVAASVALLAGALYLLASLDPVSLLIGVAAIGVMMGAVLGFIKIFDKIKPKAVQEASTLLLSFAGSMAIMSISLLMLSRLSFEDLGKGLASFVIFIASLVAMMKIAGPAINTAGKSMLYFALAIGGMTTALIVLSLIPYNMMVNGLLRLGLMLGELAIFLGVLRLMRVQSMSIVVKKLGSTLRGMALALAVLATIEPDKINSALKAMGGMMLELAVFMALMKAIQNIGLGGLPAMASGIAILSIALIGMAAALKIMSTIPSEQLMEVMKAFAIMMGIIVVAATLLSGISRGFLLFASALAILGVAMIAVGASFFIIGAGLVALITAFSSVASMVDPIIEPLLKLAGIGAAFIIGGTGFLILGVALIALGAGAVLAGAGIMLIVGALTAFSAINIPNLIANIAMFIAGLKALAPQAGEAAGNTVEAMSTSIRKRSGNLGETAAVTITNFINGLNAHSGSLVQEGVDLLMNLLDGLSVGVKNNGAKLAEIVTNIVQGLGTAIVMCAENLLSFGRDIVGTIIEGIANAIGIEIPDSVKEIVTGFTDGIGSAINDFLGIGKDMGDAVAEGTEEGSEKIAEKGKAIPEDLKTGIESGKEDATGAATDLGTSVTTAAEESFQGDAVTGAVDGMMSGITNSLENGSGDITEIAKSFGPAFSSGLGEGIDGSALTAGLTTAIGGAIKSGKTEAKKAKDVGKEASKSAGKGASDNKKPAEDGGKSIGQGLVDGIKSKTGPAGSAGYEIGRKALAEAKRAVKAKSPSREFHKLGVNIDEGLILGIKSLMGDVGKSGKALGDTAVKSTKGTIKAMSLALDGIDTAPTIRPVVDLSGIQSGVDAANSIFASQSAMQVGMAAKTSRFYDPNGVYSNQASKQVNNTISINLDYTAGADANQIVRDIAAGLTNLAFMEA